MPDLEYTIPLYFNNVQSARRILQRAVHNALMAGALDLEHNNPAVDAADLETLRTRYMTRQDRVIFDRFAGQIFGAPENQQLGL